MNALHNRVHCPNWTEKCELLETKRKTFGLITRASTIRPAFLCWILFVISSQNSHHFRGIVFLLYEPILPRNKHYVYCNTTLFRKRQVEIEWSRKFSRAVERLNTEAFAERIQLWIGRNCTNIGNKTSIKITRHKSPIKGNKSNFKSAQSIFAKFGHGI